MRSSRIDWVLFAALGLFWGSSYLFIKIGVGSLPPIDSFVRVVTSDLVDEPTREDGHSGF